MLLQQAFAIRTCFSSFPRHNQLFSPSVAPNFSLFYGAVNMRSWRGRNLRRIISASKGQSPSSTFNTTKKRKVVEHIFLLKGKNNLSDKEENDMLDYLYTSQYQMRGIVAISLGRLTGSNEENYTHAVYMRFQKKEDLVKFYENPFYLKVLKEHVMPYCHVWSDMVRLMWIMNQKLKMIFFQYSAKARSSTMVKSLYFLLSFLRVHLVEMWKMQWHLLRS